MTREAYEHSNGTKTSPRGEEPSPNSESEWSLRRKIAEEAFGHSQAGHGLRGPFHGFGYSTRGYRPSYPRQWVPSGFLRKNLEIKKKAYYINIRELVLGIMEHIRVYRNRALRLKDHLKRQYGRNERF